MTLIGMNYAQNDKGAISTTLHVAENFNSYFTKPEAGRGCVGKKVDSIYVSTYDCSNLKVGMEIEVFYDKAITNAKGTYQTIKKIEILK